MNGDKTYHLRSLENRCACDRLHELVNAYPVASTHDRPGLAHVHCETNDATN